MKTTELNRELIEGLSQSTVPSNVDNINEKVSSLVYQALASLSDKTSNVDVNRAVLLPIDESFTRAICSRSEYNYLLGIPNTEIEINSVSKKNFFKNFWKRLKYAWKKSHQKKSKAVNTEIKPSLNVVGAKYDITALRNDIILSLANFLTSTTIIYDLERYISIVGKEDFGSNIKINIYVCLYDEKTNTFKNFNYPKNRFDDINFAERVDNLNSKYGRCDENYVNMIKVYNALFSNANGYVPSQILIESLLYNCPDELYTDDLYQTFLNVSNYIRLKSAKSFKSICDTSIELFKDKNILSVGAQLDYQKLISLLDKNRVG